MPTHAIRNSLIAGIFLSGANFLAAQPTDVATGSQVSAPTSQAAPTGNQPRRASRLLNDDCHACRARPVRRHGSDRQLVLSSRLPFQPQTPGRLGGAGRRRCGWKHGRQNEGLRYSRRPPRDWTIRSFASVLKSISNIQRFPNSASMSTRIKLPVYRRY